MDIWLHDYRITKILNYRWWYMITELTNISIKYWSEERLIDIAFLSVIIKNYWRWVRYIGYMITWLPNHRNTELPMVVYDYWITEYLKVVKVIGLLNYIIQRINYWIKYDGSLKIIIEKELLYPTKLLLKPTKMLTHQ